MLSCCNFNDIDVITDFGTSGTISFGNIATVQINGNNNKFYFLQNNTDRYYNANRTKNNTYLLQNNTNQSKVSNANVYMYKQFYISFKIILNKKFLVFENTRLLLS